MPGSPKANRYRKLDDRGEAHLIALACSDAPEGHEHWTLQLLADKVVELGLVETLSYETVRLKLKKHPQAVAEAAMVHPESRRRIRGGPRIQYGAGYGGRAGPVRRTLRARRIMKRLEFHHTPKHASWLNMAEIEFSALSRACLKGRNPDADALERQITAYETQRNAAGVTINWRFSTHDARAKLHRFYPCLSNVD